MALETPRPWFAPAPKPRTDDTPAPPPIPRIPTGVPDFDPMTGGVPAGSVVLLVGEAGSGHQEFALTSAVHLMLHYDDPEMHEFYLGSARGPFEYPSDVVYVSLSRSREQVLREVQGAFDPLYRQVLERHLKFHDLSPSYFSESVVPPSWSALGGSILSGGPSRGPVVGGPLGAIAEAVEEDGGSNLVIIDALTDLVVRKGVDLEELLALVKGLRRRAKTWRGVVYLLLSRGVTTAATEEALIDSVDGVLAFSWALSPTHSARQRTMVIEKFMPVLAHIPHEHQGRFLVRVGTLNGLVTTQYERI